MVVLGARTMAATINNIVTVHVVICVCLFLQGCEDNSSTQLQGIAPNAGQSTNGPTNTLRLSFTTTSTTTLTTGPERSTSISTTGQSTTAPTKTLRASATTTSTTSLTTSSKRITTTSTSGPKGCAVFGEGGMQTWSDCSGLLTSRQQGSSLQSAPTGQLNWVCRIDRRRVMVLDGQANKAHMWDVVGKAFTDISLGALGTPVGCVYLDGKVYVAGFGNWPVPNGNSGLAIVNVATGQLENFVPYPDSRLHVHNVYSFKWKGQDEIFVAAMGNPWMSPPLTGSGLVRFNRQLNTFVTNVALVSLNARSAVQQSADIFYILTQEPAGQQSKLARVERDGDGFKINAQQTLPPRNGGDGGADVVLSPQVDVVFCSDRTSNGGKAYAYQYTAGGLTQLSSHNTGNHPRYMTALTNGDVVACNQNSNSLTVFSNLANNPSATTIPGHTVSTSNVKPMFFMDDLDI